MFGSFVLAVSSIAATLLPFPAALPSSATIPGRMQAPLGFDRVSIVRRIRESRLRANVTKMAVRPSVAPQALHYRSIRLLNGAADINNRGQIATGGGVLDSDGTYHPLSPLLSNGRPYVGAYAVALNDYGGVAGQYYVNTNDEFGGNLVWQFENGVYNTLYFDGRNYDANGVAINDYDLTVGNVGYNGRSGGNPSQAAIFSQFIPRRVLLPFNETCNFDQLWFASGINDANTIVGTDAGCNGGEPGFFEAVRFSLFGYAKAILPSPPPGGLNSFATGVNQSDDIIGYTYQSGDKDEGVSFLYQAASKRVTTLPRPAGEPIGQLTAVDLNETDQVVGENTDDDVDPFIYSAWLYTGGKTYDLNALLPKNSGWVIESAAAINNVGQIVGDGIYTNPVTGVVNQFASFVMTP